MSFLELRTLWEVIRNSQWTKEKQKLSYQVRTITASTNLIILKNIFLIFCLLKVNSNHFLHYYYVLFEFFHHKNKALGHRIEGI